LLLDEPTAAWATRKLTNHAAIRRLHRDSNFTIVLIDTTCAWSSISPIESRCSTGAASSPTVRPGIASNETVQAAYLGNPA
jgi:ABC-type branched-subunit amino acid transport system ATPase component